MIPRLYDKTETEFKTLGLGELTEATSCTVTEERNGSFELEMEYPETGHLFSEIKTGAFIMAKPNKTADDQIFRIYSISSPLSGTVTINAEHISYLMNGIPVAPFTAESLADALTDLSGKSMVTCPFNFSTDFTSPATMTVDKPKTMRECVGGEEGSLIDVYGGELELNNFNVILHKARGSDNGVTIEYGKNLTDLTQEQNIEDTYTGAVAYWQNTSDDEVVTVYGDVVKGSDTGRDRILIIDASGEYDEQPTEDELTQYATDYYNNNNIGVPKVNLTVSFVDLANTEEYKDVAPAEQVNLCDTVTVKFPKLGVNAEAKVIKTVFDVLLEKYDTIEIGDAKSTLTDTIKQAVSPAIDDQIKASQMFLQQAITYATALITGNQGGHFLWLYDDDGKPTDLLIMDTDDVSTAKSLWRWNASGLGHSDTGIDGPYTTAWTMDGQFNADYIAGKTLQGVTVKAGSFSGGSISIGSGFYVDSNGNMTCKDATVNGTLSGNISSSGVNSSSGFIQATELKDSGGNTMLSTKSDGINVYAYYNGKSEVVLTTGQMNAVTPCVLLNNTTTKGIPVISKGTSHAFTVDWDGDDLIFYVEGTKQVTIHTGTYSKPTLKPLYRLYNSTTGDHIVSNSTSENGYTLDATLGYVFESDS